MASPFKDSSSMPLGRGCQIVGYNKGAQIWAIEKAPGILSHPNPGKSLTKSKPHLLNAEYDFEKEAYHWFGEDGKRRNVYLAHRLDSPTSGIILVCLSQNMSFQLKKMFAEKKVSKTYHAIVKSVDMLKKERWKDRLFEMHQKGKMRVRWGSKGELAITDVFHEKNLSTLGLSLVRMMPLTGRTHQLRVQCAKRGIPIIGDETYGDFCLNRKLANLTKGHLYLHATEISFEIVDKANRKTKITFTTPLPNRFEKLLGCA